MRRLGFGFSVLMVGYLIWVAAGSIVRWLRPQVNIDSVAALAPIPVTNPIPSAENKGPELASAPVPRASLIQKAFEPTELDSGIAATEVLVGYVVVDGLAMYAGDLVLGEPKLGTPPIGKTRLPESKLWDRATIPYLIDPAVTEPQRISEAISLFADTPIRFVRAGPDDKDVVVFQASDRLCRSYLGKIGGAQPLWVAPTCSGSDIAHEIMHALGFVHEQNRSDRDAFVEVLKDNIQPGFEYNFDLLSPEASQYNRESDFDEESLMIYSPNAFAKAPHLVTMQSRRNLLIRPGNTLSTRDRQRLYRAYGNR